MSKSMPSQAAMPQGLLPSFATIETAGEPDDQRARELCAGVRCGEKEFTTFSFDR